MTYTVQVFLETACEAQIRAITDTLIDAGLGTIGQAMDWRPHVTFGAAPDLPVDQYKAELESFAAQSPALHFSFQQIGLFQGADDVAVFLGPVVTRPLLATHTRFNSSFMAYAPEARQQYQAGFWIPHCTVALGVPRDRAADAVALVMNYSLPIEGRMASVGLVDYPDGGMLYSFPIGAQG